MDVLYHEQQEKINIKYAERFLPPSYGSFLNTLFEFMIKLIY